MIENPWIRLAALGSFDSSLFAEEITDNVVFFELTYNVYDKPAPFFVETDQLVGCSNYFFRIRGPHGHATCVGKEIMLEIYEE